MSAIANPLLLIAELSYKCPLHCPYCSNPLTIGDSKYSDELPTEDWVRVFHEAGELGVLQLALTGGEPLVRKDAEILARGARDAGLYSNLITAGTPFTRKRAMALKEAGLDMVQVSIQDSDPIESDRIAGTKAYAKKIEAAKLARELGFPLTVNVVLHRQNLDRIESIIALAEELDARRVELANSQYQGWAAINRTALMPTREQLEHGEKVVIEARERIGPKMEILWVLPDYYEEYAEAVHGRLGPRRDGDHAERRRASVPGRIVDPGPRVRQRARQAAVGDLVRLGCVQQVPRHRLDARGVPDVSARPVPPRLRRLPLPGARARRRRDRGRSGLPVLTASRHHHRRGREGERGHAERRRRADLPDDREGAGPRLD